MNSLSMCPSVRALFGHPDGPHFQQAGLEGAKIAPTPPWRRKSDCAGSAGRLHHTLNGLTVGHGVYLPQVAVTRREGARSVDSLRSRAGFPWLRRWNRTRNLPSLLHLVERNVAVTRLLSAQGGRQHIGGTPNIASNDQLSLCIFSKPVRNLHFPKGPQTKPSHYQSVR
jgi:hypothetical protein